MNPTAARLTVLALLSACGCTADNGGGTSRPPPSGIFEDVTAVAGGVGCADEPSPNRYFMPTSIGSGAGWLDYDSDGDLDVFLVHGARGSGRFIDGKPWPSRLFRQELDGTFAEVTALAGGFAPHLGMGVAVGDLEGDGDPDLYVTAYGPDALYRNHGDGTFTEISRDAGIDNPAWGSSAIFFDDDRDGDHDLYVANYVDFDPTETCTDNGGRPDYCGPAGFPGAADLLYRNDTDGPSGMPTFTDVSANSGIAGVAAPGLGAVSADFDGDGFADLYVANDGAANQLWISRGDGTFEDRAADLGLALNAMARPEAGMGIALGDVDEDMDWDLFITHLRGETNTLYRRVGSLFHDQTVAAGLAGISVPRTGFGTSFVDFDLDGDLDLAVVNGGVTRGERWDEGVVDGFWSDYAEPGLLFENDGRGRFRDASRTSGTLFAGRQASRGLAVGDFDRDGRVDLLVTTSGGGARLLRNRDSSPASWLSVRVLDRPGGGDSLGAVVTAAVGGRRLQRLVTTSSGFLSSREARAHFGFGTANTVDLLTVRWPDGGAVRFSSLPVDRRIQVIRRPPRRKE